ncbi:MAG TPA: hypothetical protein VMR59_01510 [Patescibacteria group bacterium]|nr:hypothetical protein [Patescibacteria group bacterium]
MAKSFWEAVKNNWSDYIIVIVLGVVFYSFSLEAFLIYALIVILMRIDGATNYLRKMIRVFNITTEGKIMAIVHKLKIGDEEIDKVLEDMESYQTKEQKESLAKDVQDIAS